MRVKLLANPQKVIYTQSKSIWLEKKLYLLYIYSGLHVQLTIEHYIARLA